MDHQDKLGRLEGTLERLLTSFDALKKEKKLLEETVQKKEVEVQQLRGELTVLNKEKQHICERVDNLLATIEKWEADNAVVDDESKTSKHDNSAPQLEDPANQLFSIAG